MSAIKACVSDPNSTWVVVWSSAGTSVRVVPELMDMESVLARSQALDLSAQLHAIPFLIKKQARSLSIKQVCIIYNLPKAELNQSIA